MTLFDEINHSCLKKYCRISYSCFSILKIQGKVDIQLDLLYFFNKISFILNKSKYF